jgi:RNA polymerase sigma factor (sigma-70 family)
MLATNTSSSLALRLTGAQVVDPTSTGDELGGIGGLTRRLAAGEESAFKEFHERYFDRLYRFLLVVARGHEDQAREALQMTLLRVARYARAFESEEAFWDWVKVLARSAARDAGRRQQRYRALLERFARLWQAPPQAKGSGEEDQLRLALEESLDGLAPPDRHLVAGKYLEGHSVRELSEQTGLTEKAVESRLLRLRRLLREETLNKLNSP